MLAKGIAGETERGRSQRLDAVWSGEPLGIRKAHPTKGAVCLEAQPSCIENNKQGAAGDESCSAVAVRSDSSVVRAAAGLLPQARREDP